MMQSLFLAIFTCLTMLTCTGQIRKNPAKNTGVISSPQTSVNEGNKITLKEGENKFLKEFEMNVTFNRMLEDSRCPADAQCVWIGAGTAEITLMGTYTRPRKIKLSTAANESRGYATSAVFNGYTISLQEASPAPTTAKGFSSNSGKYKIILQFTKGEATQKMKSKK